MDFEEFKRNFQDDLQDRLSDRGFDDLKVESMPVEKLNGSYEGLIVKTEGSSIGVNANMTAMFQSCEDGADYDKVVDRAADMIEQGLNNAPNIEIAKFTDYDQMKNKLAMEVVSSDRNADMLQNVPHENIEDMAVVYRFIVGSGPDENSSILVTNNMLDSYGITQEQLHTDAMENAPAIRPSEIRGMTEILSEMMPGTGMRVDPADEQMFVASVPDKIHGAGVLAYPNFMEDAAQKLGGDYFVLPSSINEVILVRDNGQMSAEELQNMVKDVNASQVSPEEQLTDHAYHYDSKDHIFEIADQYESRMREKKMDIAEKDLAEKDSLIGDLKAKKDEVAKQAPEKIVEKVAKSHSGEVL
jgi:hypothetical protein